MFNVVAPQNLSLALELLSKENARIIAGGTDLMVRIRQQRIKPDVLVDITKIKELKGVRKTEKGIEIGAATTHTELLSSELTPPMLRLAISEIGSPQIRNTGTIGGNIVNASPAGDSLVPLYLLDTRLKIRSKNTDREIDIEKFIKGPGETDLKQDELVEKIYISSNSESYRCMFEKVGERSAMTIAIVSMGVMIKLKENYIEEIRIAYGSVAPTVLRLRELERFLTGKKLDPETLSKASKIIEDSVSPISDIRATADYRKKVAGRLIYRLLDILK